MTIEIAKDAKGVTFSDNGTVVGNTLLTPKEIENVAKLFHVRYSYAGQELLVTVPKQRDAERSAKARLLQAMTIVSFTDFY